MSDTPLTGYLAKWVTSVYHRAQWALILEQIELINSYLIKYGHLPKHSLALSKVFEMAFLK